MIIKILEKIKDLKEYGILDLVTLLVLIMTLYFLFRQLRILKREHKWLKVDKLLFNKRITFAFRLNDDDGNSEKIDIYIHNQTDLLKTIDMYLFFEEFPKFLEFKFKKSKNIYEPDGTGKPRWVGIKYDSRLPLNSNHNGNKFSINSGACIHTTLKTNEINIGKIKRAFIFDLSGITWSMNSKELKLFIKGIKITRQINKEKTKKTPEQNND